MKKRNLGNTGISVSEIAFGGVEIGLPYGIGVKSKADMITEDNAVRLLHAALDNGINLFDTARLYGDSESIMGKAFQDRRQEVVLCTKCKHLKDSDGNLPEAGEIKNVIKTSLKESLDALKTDYIDIYMLHQADEQILDCEEIKEVFVELKKEGVIQSIGASTYTPQETKKAIDGGVWDVVQLPFNLMNQTHSVHFSEAKSKGVGIMVRSVLFKGLLSGKGTNLHPALSSVEEHIDNYRNVLNGSGTDLETIAMKFALASLEVSTVLVGIDQMSYLEKALKVTNSDSISSELFSKLQGMKYPDPAFLDLVKWEKMKWLT